MQIYQEKLKKYQNKINIVIIKLNLNRALFTYIMSTLTAATYGSLRGPVSGSVLFSEYLCLHEQVCGLMYPHLVLGAHGDAGGLPRCLLRCR